jgi:hypothetical protein
MSTPVPLRSDLLAFIRQTGLGRGPTRHDREPFPGDRAGKGRQRRWLRGDRTKITLASSDVKARLKVSAGEAGFVDAGLARELSAGGRYEAGGPQAFAATRPGDLTALIRRIGQLSRALTRH